MKLNTTTIVAISALILLIIVLIYSLVFQKSESFSDYPTPNLVTKDFYKIEEPARKVYPLIKPEPNP